MGMFERLGEKVERFKQEAVAARDDSAEFRCRDCGTEFYSERESCPECGSTAIERVNRESAAESEANAEPEPTDEKTEPNAEPADTEAETDAGTETKRE